MNFIKKHNFTIILLLLIGGLLAYTVYTINQLYPEYEYTQEYSITLKSLLALTIVIANVYFLITTPIFYWLGTKLKTLKGEKKKPDYLTLLCRLTIIGLWVYVSQELYYSNTYADDVDRMIIAGIFGATSLLFDILYLIITMFTLFTRGFIDSFVNNDDNDDNKDKKHNNKNNKKHQKQHSQSNNG